MRLTIEPVMVEIEAPMGLVYQMLAALGQEPMRRGERVEVRSRDPGHVVADFWTRVPLPVGRAALVHTRESVELRPPDRVDYHHLEGALRGLAESITAEPIAGQPGHTRLAYRAELPEIPLRRYLLLRLVGQPILQRAMREHFADLKLRAEARARRSRIFAEDAQESHVRT